MAKALNDRGVVSSSVVDCALRAAMPLKMPAVESWGPNGRWLSRSAARVPQ